MKKADSELVEAIIGKMRELVDYYPKVRAFYEGKKFVEPDQLLSRKMRLDVEKQAAFSKAIDSGDIEAADALFKAGFTDNCLVDSLKPLKDDPVFFKRLDGKMLDRFVVSYDAFVGMLRKAFGNDKETLKFARELIPERSESRSRPWIWLECRNLYSNILEAGMALSWRELKIRCAHPEWDLPEPDSERALMEASSAAVAQFMQDFWGICHVLPRLAQHLKGEWKDLPGAFLVPMDGVTKTFSYEWSVRLCLSATVVFTGGRADSELDDIPEWIGDPVRECISLLHDYFVRRAAKCPKEARSLWIEADADLVIFLFGDAEGEKIDADRIVELANKAARAEWVARRLAKGYDGVKIEFPKAGDREERRVVLDEEQLRTLVAAHKGARRDAREIIGEVRKAAAGADAGCHHRDANKDKLVQQVICRLAKPGVTFSIHDACAKVGGRRNASWLYSWCNDHKVELRAAVDILRSADRAFRS